MFIFSRKKLLWRVQQLLRWQWKSTDQLRYDVARVNDFLRLKSATADHFFKADIKSFFECQRVCDLGAINLSHWGRRKLGSKMCWESSLFFSLYLFAFSFFSSSENSSISFSEYFCLHSGFLFVWVFRETVISCLQFLHFLRKWKILNF